MVAADPAVGHDDGMITVASHPADLATWDQNQDSYYLEVFGEAEPVLDMAHAEVRGLSSAIGSCARPRAAGFRCPACRGRAGV